MELVREVFRLKWEEKKSNTQISVVLRISKTTVSTYLKRADDIGIKSYKDVEQFSAEDLKKAIFPDKFKDQKLQIDLNYIHKELRRKHVTLKLLWEEESDKWPDIFSYSRLCQLYRAWKKDVDITMRQDHKAGEKAFIDYAGSTMPITDPQTGEITPAQIFVMSLGGSSYTYVEASESQTTKDFIQSNMRAFDYFGGTPEILVPDNLKAGVNMACKYEPEINRNYREMAKHYDCVVIPARGYRPKDKAIVENAVLIASRWIIAKLRNRTFFSIEELNEEIWPLLEEYNNRKFQRLDCSRKELFDEVEKSALKDLPKSRYELAQWKHVKANIDYHIYLDKAYYSVPYKLRSNKLLVRYTDHTVEVFSLGKRVASHKRLYKKGSHSTVKEHMPKQHREYLEWNPSRILNWARKIGPCTSLLIKNIMESFEHPELGYKSSLGIIRLEKKYSKERVENACKRCLKIGSIRYKSVASILAKGLDYEEENLNQSQEINIDHENIRGGDYYQ